MPASAFESVGIVLGPHDNAGVANSVHGVLGRAGVRVHHEPLGSLPAGLKDDYGSHAESEDAFGRDSDLICSIGGDGTMLNAIARYHGHHKPFTGINLGHIGFLADLSPDSIDSAFAALLQGCSCAESRMLLEVEILRDGDSIAGAVAANEVFFRNAKGVSMVFLDVFLNGRPVHTEVGDGLLVGTPTGSTAYNLSSGGPILAPGVDALVLCPICPNYLNSRPVVIDEKSLVEIRVSPGRPGSVLVGCDGQRELALEAGDVARVRKHPVEWTLLHPEDYEYFSLLRSKLNWGLGPLPMQEG